MCSAWRRVSDSPAFPASLPGAWRAGGGGLLGRRGVLRRASGLSRLGSGSGPWVWARGLGRRSGTALGRCSGRTSDGPGVASPLRSAAATPACGRRRRRAAPPVLAHQCIGRGLRMPACAGGGTRRGCNPSTDGHFGDGGGHAGACPPAPIMAPVANKQPPARTSPPQAISTGPVMPRFSIERCHQWLAALRAHELAADGDLQFLLRTGARAIKIVGATASCISHFDSGPTRVA